MKMRRWVKLLDVQDSSLGSSLMMSVVEADCMFAFSSKGNFEGVGVCKTMSGAYLTLPTEQAGTMSSLSSLF